jgi:DNA-binding protein HU-beta
MGQNDLVDAVSQATGAKKTEAARMVTAMLDAIRDALKRDGKVAISGFGSFEAVRREARPGRNPQTGAAIEIAASTTVKFKPAKGLKDAVDGGSA